MTVRAPARPSQPVDAEPAASGSGRRGPRGIGDRRRPFGIAVAVTAVVVIAAACIVIWASPVFGVRSVEVLGASSAETVTAVLDASDVPDGTPLARVDVDAVRDRVLAIDVVASAAVARSWPQALTITVTERVPVATLQANGSWWLMDAAGHAFGAAAARPADLLPLELATPGPADRATLAALDVLASLSSEVRSSVMSISAATEYGVTLTMVDGRSVIWGSADNAMAKNEVIPVMLQQPGQTFDVSDPTLVTVTDR